MSVVKDRHGVTREVDDGYILRDGESYVISVMMMDAKPPLVHDGNGNVAGQRPGFLIADDQQAEQARAEAYQQYATDISERWRQGPGQRSSPTRSAPQRTFDSPQAAVAASYAQYRADIQERWRK